LEKMTKSRRIFRLAQEVADDYGIFKARRAGAGSSYVNEVINHLKFLTVQQFGTGAVNQFLSEENRQSVDFWLEDEQTIIEMEFDILGSRPVLEQEVFKALLAKEAGNDVRDLILIGDPGSEVLARAPAPVSVMKWVERRHQIRVQIWELNDKHQS
jgi:hypothetical protein